MRAYVLVGLVAALVAYAVGERQAGGAVVPANCYTFEQGAQGCGACNPTDCGDCINGTPPTCNPATHTKCYTTNILTPVDPPAGNLREPDSKPCGGVYHCFNEGGSECIGPCVDGSFCENLPGNPTFNYYKPGALCSEPH